jgi:hypothetical protein
MWFFIAFKGRADFYRLDARTNELEQESSDGVMSRFINQFHCGHCSTSYSTAKYGVQDCGRICGITVLVRAAASANRGQQKNPKFIRGKCHGKLRL